MGPEPAHQPSLAYIPYMVTGEYYYCEEMIFWGGWNLSNGNGDTGYREGSLGIIVGQTRGWAWSLRNIADPANLTPDGMPEKAYLTEKVNNNIRWREDMYLYGYYPTMRWWAPYTWSSTPVWQDDYVMFTLGHMKEMGFDCRALVNWLGAGVVGRFTHRDEFNPYRAAEINYVNVPVTYKDALGNTVPYETWATIEAAYTTPPPTDFSSMPAPYSYAYSARTAATYVLHLAGGQDAWDWLDTHMWDKSQLNAHPYWGLLPRPAIVGDANSDGSVDVVDLLYFVDAFGATFGDLLFNPDCDFTGDASVDVVDLLNMVETFGEHL